MNVTKPSSSLPLSTIQDRNIALGSLIARAEDGDAAALERLSDATRMSAAELREALKNGGEAAVWNLAAAGFAALGQEPSLHVSARKEPAAGDTVRHLGGFRDVIAVKE